MQNLINALEQYLETFPFTKWKNVFGYQGRLKDSHFFCGYVAREDRVEVLIRTTKNPTT